MEELYGYVVYAVACNSTEVNESQKHHISIARRSWPLICIRDRNSLAPALKKWLCEGLFPETFDPRLLAHDIDYIRDYLVDCNMKGIEAQAFAYASTENVFRLKNFPAKNIFIGYDCVSEDSFESYLYSDNPSVNELRNNGFQLNRHHLFSTKDDAERYGQLRRSNLQNGLLIEDMGAERAVAVSQVLENE